MVGWKIALWVLVVGIAVWFLYLVRSILLPFVLAFIISALLDPSIKKLRMRGYKRGTAVAIVFFAFFGLVGVVGYFVFPIIGAQLTYFKDSLQAFTNQLSQENPNENYFVKWNPAVRAQPAGGPTAQVDKVIEQLAPTLAPLDATGPDHRLRRAASGGDRQHRRTLLQRVPRHHRDGFLSDRVAPVHSAFRVLHADRSGEVQDARRLLDTALDSRGNSVDHS